MESSRFIFPAASFLVIIDGLVYGLLGDITL